MPKSLQQRAEEQFERRSDLHVLFLFDPDEDYREEVEEWEHPNIRRVEASDPGFELIYRIEKEWDDEKILLYTPDRRPRDLDQYALADLLVANAELNVDEAAELADELGVRKDQKALINRYYRGDLEYQNRRDFLGSILEPKRLTEKTLKRGLAAYHLDLFSTVPSSVDHVIAGVFIAATDEEVFEAYCEKCEERGLDEPLGTLFAQRFALGQVQFSLETVRSAAQKLKYNLLTQPIDSVSPEDRYYKRLGIEETSLLTRMRTLVKKWASHGDLEPHYADVLDALAPEVDEQVLMEAYGADASFGYLTPTLRRQRVQQASDFLPEQPSKSRETVRELRESSDRGAAQAAETVWHMASFYKTLKDHPALDFSSLDDFVQAYEGELHLCDTHYRKAVSAFRGVRKDHSAYREALADAYKQFEIVYANDFVQPLNTAWQRALQENPSVSQSLQAKPLNAFYESFLGDDAPKTAVIVSDGLRYEVAAELSVRLQRDKRKEANLGTLLAPIPSITSLGKASLLPHNTLQLDDTQFLADGKRTGGTKERNAILQAVRKDAKAVRFEDIRDLSMSEGRELFKEHPLVYIYHDRIDRYGDKVETEEDTPEAVSETLEELDSLVQTLNNWNVYRVLLTADHGFLYSERITEAMQESFPEFEGAPLDQVVRRNRCLVAPSVEDGDGYRFPLRQVSNVDSDWTVAVPRAVNRYRLSGAGKKYAHGGASLQELVVPVVEVRKGRKDKAKKVDVRLVNDRNVITSGVLKVQITQTKSVSKKRRPRTLEIGLYDDQDSLVSGKETLVFDVASSDPTDRTKSAMLELKPEADDITSCRLVAYDTEDNNRLNPEIDRRFTIERLFEQDDF